MDDDPSYQIAVEQFAYWAEVGLTNAEMLAAVGLFPRSLDDDDTIRVLQFAYRLLRRREAA